MIESKDVLFFCTTPPRGGSAYLVKSMAKAIQNSGQDIGILFGVFSNNDGNGIYQGFPTRRVVITREDRELTPRVLRFEVDIEDEKCYLLDPNAEWKKEESKWEASLPFDYISEYNILHINHIGPHINAISRNVPESKIVLHIHGPEFALLDSLPDSHSLKSYYIDAIRASDSVIVNSKKNYSRLLDIISENELPIHIFTPSVDLNIYYPSNITKTKTGVIKILYIGRFLKIKRIDLLLDAFSSVVRGNKNSKYKLSLEVIGGSKGEISGVNPIEELSKYSDLDISITPWMEQQELAKKIRHADVLCMPSDKESFGLVAAEAMACGVPVIVSDGAGISEYIIQHEDELSPGWIFPAGDKDSLMKIFNELLNNPEKAKIKGDLATRLAESSFSMDKLYHRLSEVYYDAKG